MPYTTKTELQHAISAATLLQLVDDQTVGDWTTDDGDDLDPTDRLDHCIAQAGRMIDGYAQAHFSVPFDDHPSTPPLVTELATTLTIYYLYRRRRGAFGMPDDVKAEYDMAMKQLQRINEGKLDLGVEPPPDASSKSVAQYDGPEQLFTSDTLDDF